LLLVAQVALAALPNIELVTLLLLEYTLVFGLRRTLWPLAVFIGLEGLLYGFGTWWLSWLYLWPLWMLAVWLLRRCDSAVMWGVAAGAYGLCFGALCAVPYLFVGGWTAAFSYWVAGIPFDISHCAGNAVSVMVLYHPLRRALTTVRDRMSGF
jgi:energy-coupling factor transport system substrate-specific component